MDIAKAAEAQDLALEAEYVAALVRSVQAFDAIIAATRENRGADAALADFRRAAQDMAAAFNAKTDLVEAEPKSFAESTKKLHAEVWDKRVKAIATALAQEN